jgi:hypothetical protein
MRAELSAALCSPKDNPFGLNVDPTKVALDLEGKPSVKAPPFVVDLPTLTVTPLTLTVTPPTLTVTPPTIAVAWTPVTATLFVGPSLNPFAPGLTTTVTIAAGTLTVTPTPLRVTTTPLTVTTTPVTISMGSIRVHAVPVTAGDLPFAVDLDLDETKAEASFDGLHAALQGCLTLNGGEPPTPPPPPPPNPSSAVAMGTEGVTDVTIKGQGFGQTRGQGSVEVTDQGGTVWNPTTYQSWTDNQIVVGFQPALANGAYAAMVTNDRGGKGGPALFTV